MYLSNKFSNPKAIPLLLEVVPPNKNIAPKKLNLLVKDIVKTIKQTKIDATDIPDLIEEDCVSRNKPLSKIAPRDFAKLINKKIKIPIIVNRVTVFDKTTLQKKWLLETNKDYKIRYLILVGAPSDNPYPGLSVSQTAKLLNSLNTKKLANYYYGAVAIPTRDNEAKGMIEKQKAGVNFFLSQIIYESQKTIQLLKRYILLCQKEKIKPRRVLLTFAPITNSKDLKFLKSLQVFITSEIKDFLIKDEGKIAQKSCLVIRKIIKEILNCKIQVPLGINICYIRRNNLNTAQKLLTQISFDLANYKKI